MRKALIPLILLLGLAGCQETGGPEQAAEDDSADSSAVEAEAGASETDGQAAGESASATTPDPDCHLTVGWDPWEPYHHSPVGDRVQGLDIDLLRATAERADCELGFEQGSWASMLQLVRSGELDVLLGATRTSEREAFARFSEPYREETFRIHVRADEAGQWEGKSLTELLEEGFRLGLTQGYIYGENVTDILEDEQWSDQLVPVPVGELNFLNLMDFRIDGFLEDPFVAASIANRREWGVTFEALPLEVHSGDVHLMFSRETVDETVVERFDHALADLHDSGDYERIIEPYLQE